MTSEAQPTVSGDAPSRRPSREELAGLVARGRSLSARLTSPLPAAPRTDDPVVEALLDRWRQLVAEGDDAVFRKRLGWDGIDLERARAALAVDTLTADDVWPSWADTIADVVEAGHTLASESVDAAVADRSLRPGFATPFQDVLLAFVRVARVRLATLTGSALEHLSNETAGVLENRLLRQLGQLFANPLFVEFGVRRQRRQSAFSRLVATLQGDQGDEEYRRFVRDLLDGGLTGVFDAYPVLARLAGTTTELWVEAIGEFVLRLDADQAVIRETFHVDGELGPVVRIGAAVSDLHNGGRSVLDVTFESGVRLVYKPKDVALEQAYFDLLGWLSEHGAPLPFHRPLVVARAGYGWSEYVPTEPCADIDAARRYYQRAGMLLALLYGLAGNDCHYDNIVAHGEHPVLVDMETFMHPPPQAFEDDAAAEMLGARAVATEVFRSSVLQTGLLPRWLVNKDGRTHDASGLGGVGEQQSYDPLPRWVHINTDAMTVVHEFLPFRPTQNVAVLDGEPLSPNDFVEELVDGLRSMYLLLLEQRDALLAPDGPLQAFSSQPVRFLLRDTRTYALVMERASQRPYLRNGAAFSIELDVLSRALATTTEQSLFWPLRRDEQDAMERLDVPMFSARADSADLTLASGVTVRDAFTQPGFELARERLRDLSATDLERQVAYTRASLYSRTASSLGEAAVHDLSVAEELADRPLSADELVSQAVAIADELEEHAIRSPDGGTTWIGVAYLPQADRYQLEPTGYDLYSGNPGIALFLAALARVTGRADLADRARSATLQASQMVRAHPERLARGLGIGGALGTGSLLYALVRTGQLLGDPELVSDAERVLPLISPDVIDSDRGLDVLVGSAGALLGLLALYDATGRPDVLDRAVLCGRKLVATQVTDGPERGSWPTLSQTGMTGFSHGTAGIAYALLRLSALTDDAELRTAATAAMDYEARVFTPEEGNWPDLRTEVMAMTGGRPSFLTQWCHGAAGIGIARLGGLSALDTSAVRTDIDVAVAATQTFGVQSVDHLCCGSMGRSELLLAAGLRLGRPDLVDQAGRFAATVVRRAESTDGFRVMGRLPRGVGCPSLFQGTAGIGYQLVRLARPDLVPSVLAWE